MRGTIPGAREASSAIAVFALLLCAFRRLSAVQRVLQHPARHVVLEVRKLLVVDGPKGPVSQ